MSPLLITNATLINENQRQQQDVLIVDGRIAQIQSTISAPSGAEVIDAAGKLLIPGMIDDQVHFREPGFPLKGTIASESRAAVAGGITSYMEMPNVNPPTTTLQALEDKYQRAAQASLANYSFYFGATNDNLQQIRQLQPQDACGVKIFMGASTGNMLVDNQQILEQIFAHSPLLIATHCEDTPMIKQAEEQARIKYGEQVPAIEHASIRSREACLASSRLAVSLAKKHGSRLHVLHLTTAEELSLFQPATTLAQLRHKQITAEVCVHHLYFNQQDYQHLGHQIKCNPSIKSETDQSALIVALQQGIIDVIATDHAPHTWDEKQNAYFQAPSGLPLVQHALPALLDMCHRGLLSLELMVHKTSHAVAECFQIADRGYIREGYWADLVIIDPEQQERVTRDSCLYQCGWSPFEGRTLQGGKIVMTLVNGRVVFKEGQIVTDQPGARLTFIR
ncbi:MAG: dihydroorotase [Enterobacteriaceae bacterium]